MTDVVVKRLTRDNVSKFFSKLTRGDLIIYDPVTFQLEDVYKLAYKSGWLINYFPPGTDEYEKYGCFVCKALWKV